MYPGIALSKGVDLYETNAGPLITMYGPAMALFYSPASIASTPTNAIWIAYLINLIGILTPIYFLTRKLFINIEYSSLNQIIGSVSSVILVISILLLEKTTIGILKIHADIAALSFILSALCFFQTYEIKKSKALIILTSLFLVLAVWAKLPTLPVIIFPILYLILERRYREAFTFLLIICSTFFAISLAIFGLYGFGDVYYYILQFPSGSMWSYRNDLFDGTGAILKRHSYTEGIPLLFRFFVMFVEEYWYFIFSTIFLFILSFSLKSEVKFLFRSISLLTALTLPTCLAHLARFGAVENALIFANSFAIIGISYLFIYLFQNNLKYNYSLAFVIIFTSLTLLPNLKLAKSLPNSTQNSPQKQAFEYLATGKNDIYFGWYPISHLLYSGDNYTSIEVPTWVGMNQPEKIIFDLSHIPEGAKYLATCHVGYGGHVLKHYLGELKEVPAPIELSNWRLFEIKALTTKLIL